MSVKIASKIHGHLSSRQTPQNCLKKPARWAGIFLEIPDTLFFSGTTDRHFSATIPAGLIYGFMLS
jgi:hypothetical protein